jgi:two-component system LytT family response regulator
MIRVVLIDDEEFARERLSQLLSAVPDIEIVGEAANGEEAIRKIAELRPDLVLLDIQMPKASGLEVAACLPQPRPKIIFCTAFDQYAINAFELHAVDYLLKPVNRVRLIQSIERIRQKAQQDADAEVNKVTSAMRSTCSRLLVRIGERIRIVPQNDMVYFSSEEGLTRLHTRDREHVLDPTLNELEERLNPAIFFRVSRAAIVNLDYVTEVRPMPGGMADVVLKTGTTLEVSRRRLKDLLDRLTGVVPTGGRPSP